MFDVPLTDGLGLMNAYQTQPILMDDASDGNRQCETTAQNPFGALLCTISAHGKKNMCIPRYIFMTIFTPSPVTIYYLPLFFNTYGVGDIAC